MVSYYFLNAAVGVARWLVCEPPPTASQYFIAGDLNPHSALEHLQWRTNVQTG